MAYLIDPLEEKKKQDATQGLGTSGVIGSNVTASGSQGDAVVDTKAPTSSGFVNLQSYLDANKGAGETTALGMTKKVAADVDTFSGQAVDTAKKAADDMTESTKDAASTSQSIGTGITNAQGDYGAAGNFLNSSYGGPEAVDYTAGLKVSADGLNDKLGKVDDVGAQDTMLKDAYGKNGNYSSGFGALDSFLMGNDANAQKHLAGVKAKSADVTKSYDDSAGKIAASQAAASGVLDTAKNDLKGTIKNRIGFIDDVGQTNMTAKNATNPQYEGFKSASLGDGLQDRDFGELKALNGLIGDTYDPSKYGETYNAGKAPAPPPPPAQVWTAKAPAVAAAEAPTIDNFLGNQPRTEPTTISTFLGGKPAPAQPAPAPTTIKSFFSEPAAPAPTNKKAPKLNTAAQFKKLRQK